MQSKSSDTRRVGNERIPVVHPHHKGNSMLLTEMRKKKSARFKCEKCCGSYSWQRFPIFAYFFSLAWNPVLFSSKASIRKSDFWSPGISDKPLGKSVFGHRSSQKNSETVAQEVQEERARGRQMVGRKWKLGRRDQEAGSREGKRERKASEFSIRFV